MVVHGGLSFYPCLSPRPFAICPSGGDQKGYRSLPFNSQTNKQKLASEEESEVWKKAGHQFLVLAAS
jgi:hypothetical protein